MELQSDTIDTTFICSQDPFGENEGKLDYASIKYRLDAIKSRLDEKKAMGHELDDSSSEEEEQQQTREENAPEIDDWDAFLYDDDWFEFRKRIFFSITLFRTQKDVSSRWPFHKLFILLLFYRFHKNARWIIL